MKKQPSTRMRDSKFNLGIETEPGGKENFLVSETKMSFFFGGDFRHCMVRYQYM